MARKLLIAPFAATEIAETTRLGRKTKAPKHDKSRPVLITKESSENLATKKSAKRKRPTGTWTLDLLVRGEVRKRVNMARPINDIYDQQQLLIARKNLREERKRQKRLATCDSASILEEGLRQDALIKPKRMGG